MATRVVATATVKAINRKLIPTRAALTLVSTLWFVVFERLIGYFEIARFIKQHFSSIFFF